MAISVSGNLTITNGGSQTFLHGLGSQPTHVDYVLVCVTAEHGYAVGDVIRPVQPSTSASISGATATVTATQVFVRFANHVGGGVFRATQRTGSFLPVNLTNTFWRLRIIASNLQTSISADQTITQNGTFVVAHGLGAIPRRVGVALVCVTAEAGYAVGDIVWNFGVAGTNGNSGVAVKMDATNLSGKYLNSANVFTILDKTTGAIAALTNARWRVRLYSIFTSPTASFLSTAFSNGGAIGNIWPLANPYMTDNYSNLAGGAEFGYVPGDRLTLGFFFAASVHSGGAPIRNSALGRFGSGVGTSPLACVRADTGGVAALTPGRWNMNAYSDNS